MATIKDIAQLAGVSHGTVSNVLNGRGNVSMKKILKVEEAARQLGYSINDRGKQLRQEFDRSIGIVLPNLIDQHYAILYTALSEMLWERGCPCLLYLTSDIPAQEEAALTELAGKRVQCILLVTCQPNGSEAQFLLKRSGTRLIYLERDAENADGFIGFDIDALAEATINCLPKQLHNLTVITGLFIHRNESSFLNALKARLPQAQIQSFQTDSANTLIAAFASLDKDAVPDAVITTNPVFVENYLKAAQFCQVPRATKIITFTATHLVPGYDEINRVELNWKQLAAKACEMALSQDAPRYILLAPRSPQIHYVSRQFPKTKLNVMMLDGPDTQALKKLLPDFTAATGIEVQFAVFPYQELYQTICEMGNSGLYDVIRMDIVWLSALAKQMLVPFTPDSPEAREILEPMLEEVRQPFSMVDGMIYSFPFTPNVQLFFYRRDLFDDAKIRRSYYETNHDNLSIPTEYDAFARLSRFFSRNVNPNAPTDYGISVVQGTVSGIVCEFLPILFSLGGSLFDTDGSPCLSSPIAYRALDIYLSLARDAYCVPPGGWWSDSIAQFTSGKTAMLNMFINHVSNITNLRKSRIAGRIGYASIPGGKPLLGGGVLGIAAASQKKEAALEFIRWACSPHISVPFTLLGGLSPCRNVYQNEDLLNLYPWLSIVPANYANAVMRTVPAYLSEHELENILGISIKNALFHISTPKESLLRAQAQVEALRSKIC